MITKSHEFDFEKHVRGYRFRRWRIDNGSARISKVFAMHYVLGLRNSKQFATLVRRTNRFRALWIMKLKDLTARRLWFIAGNIHQDPDAPGFDLKKFDSRLRRCMHCRPVHVHFASKDGKSVQIHPCRKVRICPFCWLNSAVALFVYTKRALNNLIKAGTTDLTLICRIVRHDVRAENFNAIAGCTPEKLEDHVAVLRRRILQHKSAYDKLCASKHLQRRAVGSLWRVVVVPHEHGWLVESRQVLLCRTGVRPPLLSVRGAKKAHQVKYSLSGLSKEDVSEVFFHTLGAFCQYPLELLTGYTEFTAAYLRASHNLRLISGTGVWNKTGYTLIRYMKAEVARAKAKKERAREEVLERRPSAETPPQDAGAEGPIAAPV